jgi:signal transduction histidine kinase
MNSDENRIHYQLRKGVQIAGADWAALLERVAGKWNLHTSYRLSKPTQNALKTYLSQTKVDSWLCGALGSRSSRSRLVPKNIQIGSERLYAIPVKGGAKVILVGAKKLVGGTRHVWKLVAVSFSEEGVDKTPIPSTVIDPLAPAMKDGLPYDLPGALDQVLASIAQQVLCQGAWLGIRRGDVLEIASHWRSPHISGRSVLVDSSGLLMEVSETHSGLYVNRDEPRWDEVPQLGLKGTTGCWGCVPLLVGQRLIGMVGLWRLRPFGDYEWKMFIDLVNRFAPSVEVIFTFVDLSGHLRRLAMLNDFVLTVSSGQNVEQLARRVFALLTRAFQIEKIDLHLLSTDHRVVREYHTDGSEFSSNIVSLAGHPLEHEIRKGKLQHHFVRGPEKLNALRARIQVPLKYRGRPTGLLILDGERADEFSVYDVHLITVVSGHLAGLVEYSSLREEAEARARNLGLIHEVVQDVIGLLDKQEVIRISAELLAQYFGYEFAIILIIGNKKNMICGVGGTRAPSKNKILTELSKDMELGITSQVLREGESVLENDTSKSQIYRPLEGWSAGSELCVPLKDGEQVLGFIDVESSAINSFGHNDLMALESLAGILTSVISNADQYQRLQETNKRLLAMQDELKTRIVMQTQAERKLIQAEKLAAVGEMAAGVAHELNNPLTTVVGFTELVLEDLPENNQNQTDLKMVLHEARRARDVVRRLLDFSRRSEIERTRVDLNDVLKDVLALTNHLLHTSGVMLTTKLTNKMDWIFIDRNQMKQVFLNLLHNALQAMPNGGELTVESKKRQHNGRAWVTASIRDTGIGIHQEDLEHLFEPFFTTRSKDGGTGLGLSVSYGIVSDHGGFIEVNSEEKTGTCFTVWLPV